jgi:hypothetical protein
MKDRKRTKTTVVWSIQFQWPAGEPTQAVSVIDISPQRTGPNDVAVCVCNPDGSPLQFRAETLPQLQPALLKLSAMICQYFTRAAVSEAVVSAAA